MEFAATEIDRSNGCKHVAIHVFEVSKYIDIVSCNAFFNSLKKRNWSISRIFVGKTKAECEMDKASLSRTLSKLNMPIIETVEIKHNSIWDF